MEETAPPGTDCKALYEALRLSLLHHLYEALVHDANDYVSALTCIVWGAQGVGLSPDSPDRSYDAFVRFHFDLHHEAGVFFATYGMNHIPHVPPGWM